MIGLRVLARIVGVVWMVVLALLGLGVALYCVDALVGLGSVRPDRLLSLPDVRRHVGRFLDQLAAPGSTAGLALLCGLAAMLIGILLMIGIVGRRRHRLAILEQDRQTGAIAARPRALKDMARALAGSAEGATSVNRPQLSLHQRGTRGELKINVVRSRSSNPHEVQAAVEQTLEPITGSFDLKPRVRVRLDEGEARVQ